LTHVMETSAQISRRTTKAELAERLLGLMEEDIDRHDEEVLREFSLDPPSTTRRTIMSPKALEWIWTDVPYIQNRKPWLVFLYGGKFTFADQAVKDIHLEMYECPEVCSQICLWGITRILIIYK